MLLMHVGDGSNENDAINGDGDDGDDFNDDYET